MANHSIDPLGEIRRKPSLRYLTVKPEGFVLEADGAIVLNLQAEILGHGGARTLYRGRRPHCRSLNGVNNIKGDQPCGDCYLLKHCTPQVRIDLLIERKTYLLLLSHTSARQFLQFVDALKAKGTEPEEVAATMRVINRGMWGEVAFAVAD